MKTATCPESFRGLRGYPAWIRTKNNASKGRCVTVTPRGKSAGRFTIFDGATEVATGAAKNLTHADEISSPLNTPKDAKIHRTKKPSGSAERRPTKRNPGHAGAKIVGRSF